MSLFVIWPNWVGNQSAPIKGMEVFQFIIRVEQKPENMYMLVQPGIGPPEGPRNVESLRAVVGRHPRSPMRKLETQLVFTTKS